MGIHIYNETCASPVSREKNHRHRPWFYETHVMLAGDQVNKARRTCENGRQISNKSHAAARKDQRKGRKKMVDARSERDAVSVYLETNYSRTRVFNEQTSIYPSIVSLWFYGGNWLLDRTINLDKRKMYLTKYIMQLFFWKMWEPFEIIFFKISYVSIAVLWLIVFWLYGWVFSSFFSTRNGK